MTYVNNGPFRTQSTFGKQFAEIWSNDNWHTPGYLKDNIQTAKENVDFSITDLRNKIVFLQGEIMELQREAASAEKYEASLYEKIERASRCLDGVVAQLNKFNKQIEHAKDIVDSLKVSQELSDGFSSRASNYRPVGLGINSGSVGSTSPNTAKQIAQSIINEVKTKGGNI